jgi:hypothetical protein
MFASYGKAFMKLCNILNISYLKLFFVSMALQPANLFFASSTSGRPGSALQMCFFP